MVRRWLNVELEPGREADDFRRFLGALGVKYEASEAFNLIHFECLMDEVEAETADRFLRRA